MTAEPLAVPWRGLEDRERLRQMSLQACRSFGLGRRTRPEADGLDAEEGVVGAGRGAMAVCALAAGMRAVLPR